jgi:hypothetical protein
MGPRNPARFGSSEADSSLGSSAAAVGCLGVQERARSAQEESASLREKELRKGTVFAMWYRYHKSSAPEQPSGLDLGPNSVTLRPPMGVDADAPGYARAPLSRWCARVDTNQVCICGKPAGFRSQPTAHEPSRLFRFLKWVFCFVGAVES